ncbi:UDP-N-acetylglucosamine 2-epimerase [Salegentibacter salarius]|uniref:UDP-N-acetyl-D-glucosamine 2-epimerase, UDP-hydrolysing n=1 Tax=Salegentibacter salarius TaxID=435906 RepID=A0A2N0TQ88_9FLAO|nr:UDP-N-acetylglucosamine 2-epimerase [Salegentibacter salarius]OEY71651.1 UDP-N-acetyl-D-glucosamine 2-epimerase, UDP-hydrolysing [Salegentibacter salarius]PKD16900.1 UDP-N-acetyl-D-glucosamine 2-epimerase, UDP-hydrolysing [Salegentibacter salarius]SLJ90863.1 UDP-N-acetylglucosamine 2-epimerase (hydrolysing) [Salegentibacter salarius]
MNKKILFLTGTRADFGKIKSLIQSLEQHSNFEVFVFVTGMHLQWEYGYTLLEIERCNFSNVHTFGNHTHETTMDLTLAKTIEGLSEYIKKVNPDLIVVHGDRVETLAGAIVGSLNNILVAHIEGGEISGTVDELIRHSVSKLSHIHFVSNIEAARRLEQMGEIDKSIFVIGSPDIDLMFSKDLPVLSEVKEYYEIPFEEFAVAMFHPVTTEAEDMKEYAQNFVQALLKDDHNYVVIYPNNDWGSSFILKEYMKLKGNKRFRVIPSLRFEYFLSLLKEAQFIIGNSSAGIREAPYYNKAIINIGTRQQNRARESHIVNVGYDENSILESLKNIQKNKLKAEPSKFGDGNSTELFLSCLEKPDIWMLNQQKQFKDLP